MIYITKEDRIKEIKKNLIESRKILNSISDENRQNILLVLLENCHSNGIRVEQIAKKVHLSRPAVSHHLKTLMENGIVSVEHIGTKNYYHIVGIEKILSLKQLFNNIELYIKERSE